MSIVNRLGHLPLAIDQAGAFLQVSKEPLQNYVPLFNQHVKYMLSKKPPPAVWQYRDDTVFTTWEVSFRAIESHDGGAANLLLNCSFLSNLDITIEFLSRGFSEVDSKFCTG